MVIEKIDELFQREFSPNNYKPWKPGSFDGHSVIIASTMRLNPAKDCSDEEGIVTGIPLDEQNELERRVRQGSEICLPENVLQLHKWADDDAQSMPVRARADNFRPGQDHVLRHPDEERDIPDENNAEVHVFARR